MPGPGIAKSQSIAAGVETGDLQPHQFAYDRIDRALAREGGAEGGECLEDAGVLRVCPRARRGAGLALGFFTEMPNLVVDLVDSKRLDPRHDRLLAQGCFYANSRPPPRGVVRSAREYRRCFAPSSVGIP